MQIYVNLLLRKLFDFKTIKKQFVYLRNNINSQTI